MLKRILQQPWPDWRLVRLKRWIELLVRLSFKHGLLESAWKGMPQINDEPIPWISFPAIEFLDRLLKPTDNVLEFGAGASTIWLANRCKKVTSVESNRKWLCTVNEHIVSRGITNATVWEEGEDAFHFFPLTHLKDEIFDVVLIDGLIAERMRFNCFQSAQKILSPEGIIIIDNIDWLGYTRKAAVESGFYCIPFMGFSTLIPYSTTTLVMLKEPRILHGAEYIDKLTTQPSPINGLVQEFEYGS